MRPWVSNLRVMAVVDNRLTRLGSQGVMALVAQLDELSEIPTNNKACYMNPLAQLRACSLACHNEASDDV